MPWRTNTGRKARRDERGDSVSATLFESPVGSVNSEEFVFTVFGTPRPQGSAKAFLPKGWKRPVVTSDNTKLKPWRQEISGVAMALNAEVIPARVPVAIELDFYLARPPSVAKSRPLPSVKPDLDKLLRATLDALTGILFHDDAQVVDTRCRKFYGMPERVEIRVRKTLSLTPKPEDP